MNALKGAVLKRRICLPGETEDEMYHRVARFLGRDVKEAARFYRLMRDGRFLPNSPTLMNAGTPLGQLSACFVVPIEDDTRSIFNAVKYAALIHKSGGGTGFNFSNIRPRGSAVGSTKGVASGPLSFMRVFDVATDVMKQGGKRRGANMGILNDDHPDIQKFIWHKTTNTLSNFNLSVMVKTKLSPSLRHEIAHAIHACGDPGILWRREINRQLTYYESGKYGTIDATNPCGEQPLHAWESCNLGSVNLAAHVRDGEIDWSELANTIEVGVDMLNRVVERNLYPLPQIEKTTKDLRRIGLGVMGLADALVLMGHKYDSKQALNTADDIAYVVCSHARKYSDAVGYKNTTVTSVAPTGTLSILAGCSSGIEPIWDYPTITRPFGDKMYEIPSPLSEGVGHLVRRPLEVHWKYHVDMAAVWQEYVEAGVSKTVNVPAGTTPKEIEDILRYAEKRHLKGVTVFVDQSKGEQIYHSKCDLKGGECG